MGLTEADEEGMVEGVGVDETIHGTVEADSGVTAEVMAVDDCSMLVWSSVTKPEDTDR